MWMMSSSIMRNPKWRGPRFLGNSKKAFPGDATAWRTSKVIAGCLCNAPIRVGARPDRCASEKLASKRTLGGAPVRSGLCRPILRRNQMDPNNPVVKLCVAGVQAEGEGRIDDAH